MPVSPIEPAPLDEFELVTNSRWGSRNRTPTPTPRNPSATSSSQTTPQDDVWQTFTQHYDPVNPVIHTVPDVTEEDSDGLEFPPSDIQLNRPPVLYHNQTQPAPAPEPEFRLQPVLATLANTANYNPIAITGSDNSYNIPHVPAIFLRHTYPSAPGDINLATTSNPLWQLPSNILYQLYNMTPQNQQHTIQQAITPWGLFTRMGLPDYAGLDIVLGSSLMSDGRAATGKFNEWVTSKLKERSQIWKQERLYLQERRHGKGKGGGKADDDDDDDEDGAKKRKKKKKVLKDGKGGGKDPPATS